MTFGRNHRRSTYEWIVFLCSRLGDIVMAVYEGGDGTGRDEQGRQSEEAQRQPREWNESVASQSYDAG